MAKRAKKIKEIPITKELWMSILAMDSKNKFNKNLNCKFVSEEKISSNTYDSLWRLTVVDCESNELYCIKYVRFIEDGKLDIDINNPYYCKIYKI
jgi:hypothetical protein